MMPAMLLCSTIVTTRTAPSLGRTIYRSHYERPWRNRPTLGDTSRLPFEASDREMWMVVRCLCPLELEGGEIFDGARAPPGISLEGPPPQQDDLNPVFAGVHPCGDLAGRHAVGGIQDDS